MYSMVLFLSLLTTWHTILPVADCIESPTVTIHSGIIVGTTTSLSSATASVHKFLGIPFAKTPPDRFSPPQHHPRYDSPINATSWKSACIQAFPYPVHNLLVSFLDTPHVHQSEDCLYLNVYAPSTPSDGEGRAVMFFLHGGGLQYGTAVQPLYDGSAFAAYQDVIMVTTNYRTNVYGFPGSPELAHEHQNLGFLDQRAALEWVRRNIGAFGGDPNKVTILGQSAGGWSIDALLTSYTVNPPFQAAILQSGQFSYNPSNLTGDSSSWDALAAALDCRDQGSQLACLRGKSAADIRHVIERHALSFLPIPDNVTLMAPPGRARANEHFAHVPVMCGTTGQEARDFEVTQNNTQKLLEGIFGTLAPQIIPSIVEAYGTGKPYRQFGYDVNTRIVTDFAADCTHALFANETAKMGVPIWRYLFNASFSNTQLAPDMMAYHGSDIPIVFGTYPGGPVNALTSVPMGRLRTNVPPTAQEKALSWSMQSAWASFAKCPQCGPGWNAVGTFSGRDVADFGANGSSGSTLIRSQELDSTCHIFNPYYVALNGPLPGL